MELDRQGINLVIGPVFYKNLIYLDQVNNLTFLSLQTKHLVFQKM